MPSNLGRIVGSRILSGTETTSAGMKTAFQNITGRKALDGDTYISTTNNCIYVYSGTSDAFNLVVDISSLSGRVDVIETGQLTHIAYSKLQAYQVVVMYGFRDGLGAPNQFCLCFIPDQLTVNGEDLQFTVSAGPSDWVYHLMLKRNSDGNVYWWSDYDYSGNTTFYVTKIVGVK